MKCFAFVLLVAAAFAVSGANAQMAGGWTVVDVATLNSTELAATVQEYMLLAAEQYDDLDCDAAEAELTPTAVGTQVVAGTNYKISFEAACPGEQAVELVADVFEPLPSSNEEPKVNSVTKAAEAEDAEDAEESN